ncbi:hypothetical protein NEAUS04_1812 [Nematocida ausubeli]|nr:hypothetical protein NEAUS04_1812 [Nematocida ausubeli]
MAPFKIKSYFLLIVAGLVGFAEIRLYLRASDAPVLSKLQSDTLECTDEGGTAITVDSVGAEDVQANLCSSSISNKKDLYEILENIKSDLDALCILEKRTETESLEKEEEKSVPALDSNEKEDQDSVQSKEEDSSILDGLVDSDLCTCSVSMPQPESEPGEQKSSALVAEESDNGIENARLAVYIAEEEYEKELEMIEEMDTAVNSASRVFQEKNNSLKTIKSTYEDLIDVYILCYEKIDAINREINACYKANNPLEIPIGLDAEYDRQIKRINALCAKIDALEMDRKIMNDMHLLEISYAKMLKNKMHQSINDSLKYYLNEVRVERHAIQVIECTLEMFKRLHARDKLMCSAREREIEYFKKDEERTNRLKKLVELHRKYIVYVEGGIDVVEKITSIQKEIMPETIEVYNAYNAYDIAKSAFERQEINVNRAEKALCKAENKLREYTLSGSQYRLVTRV